MRRKTLTWQPSIITHLAGMSAAPAPPGAIRPRRRRWRMLPPAGAPIAYGTVLRSAVRSVLESGTGLQAAVAQRLARDLGLPHWVFLGSGRAALSAAMLAFAVRRPGCDEVVIPAYTSYSVPAAVVRAGFKVRLCDIEEETLGLDPHELDRVVTRRTLCVLSHHLFGLPCRMAEIHGVAQAHGLPVLEDAAQAMGGSCGTRPAGATGEVGVFSVSRGKTLPGAGGGVLGTRDETLAAACRTLVATPRGLFDLGLRDALTTWLMASFIRPSRYWLPASVPFLNLGRSWYDPFFPMAPMTRFQCALLAQLLPGLEKIQQGRRARATRVREALSDTRVQVLWPSPGDQGGFLRLALLVPDTEARRRLVVELRHQGLGATDGYPHALSRLPELRPDLAAAVRCPVAERVSRQLITLPTHAWVTEQDLVRMREAVTTCVS